MVYSLHPWIPAPHWASVQRPLPYNRGTEAAEKKGKEDELKNTAGTSDSAWRAQVGSCMGFRAGRQVRAPAQQAPPSSLQSRVPLLSQGPGRRFMGITLLVPLPPSMGIGPRGALTLS